VFSDDKTHLKSLFLKVKVKQVLDRLKSADDVRSIERLEAQVSTEFLREAVQDYKDLFLTPLWAQPNSATGAVSARPHTRLSNSKSTRDAIVLKSEQEERQETKDFAKYATSVVTPYLNALEQVLLRLGASAELRQALSHLDQTACQLETLCCYEYRIERSQDHQRHLQLMKQTN